MFTISIVGCFLLATASGLPMSSPTFEWLQGDPIHKAALKITFPNGKSDIALLNPYNPIPSIQRSDLCIFNGYLKEESNVYVALTGCPNSENFEIMFRSKHLSDFMFRVTSGQVEHIKPLLGSTAINRDGLQVTYKDRVVRSQDSILSKDFEQTRELNPSGYVMKVKLRYDDGFLKKFPDNAELKLAEIMNIAQAQFKDPSLTTTIDLDISAPEHISGNFNAKVEADLNTVSSLSTDPNYDAYVYLVCSDASEGTLGVAWLGTTCEQDVSRRTSLNEYDGDIQNTGLTVAHEMGHNLGMSHDFGPKGEGDIRKDSKGNSCTKVGGIMDYSEPFKLWTTCSIEDFTAYVNQNQPFCLKAK